LFAIQDAERIEELLREFFAETVGTFDMVDSA